jgi:hypothetical protein
VNHTVHNANRTFGREILLAYGFPMLIFGLATVPVLNFTFSGHGGPGWFVAPLCFPSVILQAVLRMTKGAHDARDWYKRFFKTTIPAYVAFAYPLSWVATKSIGMTFGLRIEPWKFFAIMVSPFPWWYLT